MKDSVYFNIEFISEIEKHPHLYDFNLPEYSNRKLIEETWARIGEKFNETGHDCKTKWKAIRSAYIRSLNTKYKSASSRDYYLAGCLKFLNPFTKSKTPRADESEPEDETPGDAKLLYPFIKVEPADSDTEASGNSSSNQLPKRKRGDRPGKVKRTKTAQRASPCDMFLLSVKPHMLSMSEQQQLTFQRGVLELIDNIKYQTPRNNLGPETTEK